MYVLLFLTLIGLAITADSTYHSKLLGALALITGLLLNKNLTHQNTN